MGGRWRRLCAIKTKKCIKEHVNINLLDSQNTPCLILRTLICIYPLLVLKALPYALIEAASVGLPIVATDVVGNNEVVLHDYNGLVFKTEQEAVVDAIKKLSINADLLNRYSINSRELYLKTFTMEKMISSIVDTVSRF